MKKWFMVYDPYSGIVTMLTVSVATLSVSAAATAACLELSGATSFIGAVIVVAEFTESNADEVDIVAGSASLMEVSTEAGIEAVASDFKEDSWVLLAASFDTFVSIGASAISVFVTRSRANWKWALKKDPQKDVSGK